MLLILTIAVKQNIHACIRNLEQMSNTNFRQEFYWRLALFHFLKEKFPNFICAL